MSHAHIITRISNRKMKTMLRINLGIVAMILGVVNGNSPSCPSTVPETLPVFDQSCRNVCGGVNSGEIVGPGSLKSVASQYDVAAFYFGHQD